MPLKFLADNLIYWERKKIIDKIDQQIVCQIIYLSQIVPSFAHMVL